MASLLFKYLNKIIHLINQLSEFSGRVIAWLVLLMMLVIVYDVSMRAGFNIGSVVLQELQWHFFALIFLLGAAYTFRHDEHVRVDVFYRSRWMNDYRRAWVNLLGGLLLLLPFCWLIISSAWHFVFDAYIHQEGSPDGGLPYRFILKAALPLGFFLLMLQGIAQILNNLLYILSYQKDQ